MQNTNIGKNFVRNLKIGKTVYQNGLMNEDLILTVNGEIALTKSKKEVLDIIELNSQHILLVVLGPKAVE